MNIFYRFKCFTVLVGLGACMIFPGCSSSNNLLNYDQELVKFLGLDQDGYEATAHPFTRDIIGLIPPDMLDSSDVRFRYVDSDDGPQNVKFSDSTFSNTNFGLSFLSILRRALK